ncbi:hypothetical protein D6D27_08976 [Aureobasidium pullulans]|nr:hypothetical protein D6D27_08976 [Aureobasidium pullulans]
MSTARPKRNRAQVNYVEPTELDDDIAVEDDPIEVEAAAEPVGDQSPDSDSDSSDSEPDADEFTTDKRKMKAQEKALKKKKAAKKAKKANKAKKIKDVPFPFMDLPPEIRVMIYKEALVESARELTYASKGHGRNFFRGYTVKKPTRWGSHKILVKHEKTNEQKRTSLQPVLLRVCKAFRDEALPFFYGQKFHFATPATLQLFLARISPINRMLLRHIVLRGWADWNICAKDLHHVFAMLTSATNIKSILLDRIIVGKTDGNRHMHGGDKFWEDIQWWADAVDSAHGKGAAKDVLKIKSICFGSKEEIKNKEKDYIKRKKSFMANLKFSVKPTDKPVEHPAEVAVAVEEASDGPE